MHVILLSHEYPPFFLGGIGTLTKELAGGLSRNGVRVTVVSGYPVSGASMHRHNIDQSSENGVTVLRYPHPNIPPRHTMFQLVNFKLLCKTIESIDADVVHGQGGSMFPVLLYLKNLAPIVTTFHSSPNTEKNMAIYSLLRGGSLEDFWTSVIGYPAWTLTFRKELSNSRMGVAVSKTLLSELLEEMGECYHDKIREIHNGIDIETLDKEYGNVEVDAEEHDNTILFAGRLFWRKGVLNLIKIAYLLRKEQSTFKVVVHGNGPLFGRMKKEIRKLGLANLELKGFTSKKDLLKSMKESRFVIIPSLYEACPMILLESMCLGKIPLMFDLPYAQEFTENGKYGVLAKTPEDMVAKIKSIHENCDTMLRLANEIREYARKEYDMNAIALQYCRLYREVLD